MVHASKTLWPVLEVMTVSGEGTGAGSRTLFADESATQDAII